MKTIVEIEQPSPFARVLREQMERMLGYSDALLFHDDLAEVSTPFYFHEFIEHAAARGLQFLSEADLFESQMRDVPESAGRLMASLPQDAVVREQYMDFFKNRMFRQTLICHEAASIDRVLDEAALEGLWISSRARPQEDADGEGEEGRSPGESRLTTYATAPGEDPEARTFLTPEGFSMTTSEPLVQAAVGALARGLATIGGVSSAAGPRMRGRRTGRAARIGRGAVAQRVVAGILGADRDAHGLPAAGGRRGGQAARRQSLGAGAERDAGLKALSSLLHVNVRLDGDLEGNVLGLLDGTRTVAEVAVALDAPPEQIVESVARLASVGLLLAT